MWVFANNENNFYKQRGICKQFYFTTYFNLRYNTSDFQPWSMIFSEMGATVIISDMKLYYLCDYLHFARVETDFA